MRTSVVIEWLSILRNEYGRWRHIETLFMRGVHLGAIDWAPDNWAQKLGAGHLDAGQLGAGHLGAGYLGAGL